MVNVVETTDESIFQTYKRYPVVLDHGKGCLVWDDTGKEYLDFLAGISVLNVGHSHPVIVDAIRQQAGLLMHVSNLYYTENQGRLGQALAGLALGGFDLPAVGERRRHRLLQEDVVAALEERDSRPDVPGVRGADDDGGAELRARDAHTCFACPR